MNIKELKQNIQLTDKQKELYIKEYLYDELCTIDFDDNDYLMKYLGTNDIKEIVIGIVSYPLEHYTVDDMYNHMDDKYFHLLTNEQIQAWKQLQKLNSK